MEHVEREQPTRRELLQQQLSALNREWVHHALVDINSDEARRAKENADIVRERLDGIEGREPKEPSAQSSRRISRFVLGIVGRS